MQPSTVSICSRTVVAISFFTISNSRMKCSRICCSLRSYASHPRASPTSTTLLR